MCSVNHWPAHGICAVGGRKVEGKMSKPVSRKPLDGYPVNRPFGSISEIRTYLSGERITCLRCGRTFKGLSFHVWKVHGITTDDYKGMYGIPWTYGLVCKETSAIISENSSQLFKEGVIGSHNMDMDIVRAGKKRKRVSVRDEICTENLSEVNKFCDGEITRQRKLAPKRGTKEFHDKMASRPQCSSPEAKTRLRTLWRGKKRDGERGKMKIS